MVLLLILKMVQLWDLNFINSFSEALLDLKVGNKHVYDKLCVGKQTLEILKFSSLSLVYVLHTKTKI